MLSSVLMVAAMSAGMMWYAGRTDWRVLFSGLDAKDTQQVAQELTAAGIPYQITEDGSGIAVDADQVDKARMEIATKGMPQSGRMGFELFDKPNWVGSEFDEKVNYQRAMEGELEHTIATIAAVRSARVHLVLPQDSLFDEGAKTAKAAVVLQLRHSSMPPPQVEAIRSLVAGAVENLSPDDVTLVDADGRLNLNARGPGVVADDAERGLEDKLVAMLEPTAGSGNVRATVNVSYDDSSQEKTDDVYDPAQVATLTMHKSQQTLGSKAPVSGVPGTASNTPAAAAVGSVAARGVGAAAVPPLMQTTAAATQTKTGAAESATAIPVYPQGGGQGGEETSTDESNSFAVTRHQSHFEQGPGRIRRMTAAVVVNDRMSSEGAGKLQHVVWKQRSPEEMQRLEQLARAAVGFDATRGDEVVIENVSFSSNLPEISGTPMQRLLDESSSLLSTQPGMLKTLSVLMLGLLLMMMVLKPMTRQMMTALSQTPPLALSAGRGGSEMNGMGGRAADGLTSGRMIDTQGLYDHVSAQIRKEPTQSTRLLESWISETTAEGE
jgi:flagellar M-ring protein FliF